MKNFLLLILFFVFINNPFCQSSRKVDHSKVAFVSYWSLGDTYDFKVTKTKERWKEGVLTQNETSQYVAKFEVIDSTKEQYTIKWSFKQNLTEYNIPEEVQSALSQNNITDVIYTTTDLGEFIEIKNWEEIRDKMTGLFDEIFKLITKQKGESSTKIQKSIEPLLEIYKSKQGIEQLLLPEISLVHFPFGAEFSVSKSVKFQEELPNMFGGNPIKANSKLFIERADFDLKTCVLKKEMKLNPKDVKGVLEQVFSKMGLSNQEYKKAMKSARFDIVDQNRFEYLYYPGVPIKIETERVVLMDMSKEKGKRINKIIIELIE